MKPEHFVPFGRADVVRMCTEALPENERDDFEIVCRILTSLVHHGFQSRIDSLKQTYEVLHPNGETRRLRVPTEGERHEARLRLERELVELAKAANFTEVGRAELEGAYRQDDLLRIRIAADLDSVKTLLMFRRGATPNTESVKTWFGLRRKPVSFVSYSRVLVYATFMDSDYFDEKNRRRLPFEPGSTIIKMFQNVPSHDLEMVLPNPKVQMGTADKALIGVPAVGVGIAVLASKAVALLPLVWLILFWLGLHDKPEELTASEVLAVCAGLGALGGYLFRQWTKFKNRRIFFMKTLADNLYFRNLDNDAGVFHHLLDAAEESEVNEAVLAYHFLRTAERPITADDLDGRIERWFHERWDAPFDFEVEDGLRKLRDFELVNEDSRGRLSATALAEAKWRLDQRWDNIFVCEQPTPSHTA